ncbi:MAG: restriction endonuclease subunit S, partial [bacterium]
GKLGDKYINEDGELVDEIDMKDSEVEWLKEVPKNWRVKKIKYLFKEISKKNKDTNEINLALYTDKGVKIRSELKDRGNKAQTVIGYKKVEPNDIVINKMLAWMGAFGMSEYKGVVSPAYLVFRKINNLVNPKYYHYYFRYSKFKGDCYKRGSGIMMMRWTTNSDQIKDIPVLLPSKKIQDQIVININKKTTEIDKLIGITKKSIEKHKKYKKSLIFEAVTGKIDLRNYKENENGKEVV